MKTTKKTLTFALVLAALLCLLVLSASAYDGTEYGSTGMYYRISNGEATITDAKSDIKIADIPKSIDGYPVARIGDYAFSGCTGLTSITIPDSVTSISYSAFSGCDGLTSITIPDSVTSIGNGAFENCTGLTSVTIPDSVTLISAYAFSGCTGLTSVTISDSVTGIDDYAFSGCTGLTKINWNAENIEDFDSNDFVFSNAGTSGDGIDVTLGDNVKHVPAYLFYSSNPNYKSPKIKTVTLGNSVTNIGDSAFRSCTGLTAVPDSVTNIGSNALDDTAWYNSQPYGDVYAGKVYYKYKGTMLANTKVTIKDGIKSIAGSAFSDCDGLTSVTIPDSVTSIGNSAFYECTGLTSITIPDSVTSIGGGVFYNCYGLTSVTIPDSVTSIGDSAFRYCNGLTSVTIGNSVTSIGSFAFNNCFRLTSITIPDSVTSIDDSAFSGCPFTTLKIGKGLKSIGKNAFKGIKVIPEIFYAGSEAEWKSISIDSSNDLILRATMHYNADLSHTHNYIETVTKKATCTEDGVKTFTCNCGKTYTETIPATGHKYVTETHEATCTSIGVSIKRCELCGNIASATTTPVKGHSTKTSALLTATETESGILVTSCETCGIITGASLINRIESVSLSKTSYTYNGKTQKPKVVVKTSKGKLLTEGKDYTVKYPKGMKNPGTYTVTITFKGNYSGKKTLMFTIAPKAPTLKVKAGAKKATLSWNKQTGSSGYVVYMATSKNGKYKKLATVNGGSKTSYTAAKLTKGKTVYFKVVSYTASGKTTVRSAYSKPVGAKIK